MAAAPAAQPPPGPAADRVRAAAEYALNGDLRFLSHHDELRLLARALVRARWPLAYTRGFNPHARLIVPLPRSVGTAARSQWLLVDLRELQPLEELFNRLSAALPPDCRLRRVVAPVPRSVPHARRVLYEIALEPEDASAVAARAPRMLAEDTLVVERSGGPGKPTQNIDIRPYIDGIEVDGHVLRLRLLVVEQRSARPSEVLTKLGLAAPACMPRLRRGEIRWDKDITGPTCAPVPDERKSIGQEDNEEEDHP